MEQLNTWIKINNKWEIKFDKSGHNHSALDEKKEISNLLNLEYTNSPEILFHLQKRYHQNLIYTFAGKILIAINPFQPTNLYSLETQQEFADKIKNHTNYIVKTPHLYELANHAILSDINSLSFLISGESGSGKTESTKKLLDYFALNYHDVNNILPKILEYNAILEAFGNATTTRNHNSSRFGKYISININNRGEISASIKTYLLEKIRVISDKLCNYHIFYSCGYKTNIPDYFRNPREDWDSKYLQNENLERIWKKDNLGDIYWNDLQTIINFLIQFLENNIDQNFLNSNLVFLKIEDIENVLSTKTIKTAEEIIKTKLTKEESITVKQTIIMTLYDKLFDRIVELINGSLGKTIDYKKSYGILDIFGFEVFDVNNFEQLCINYTNERLQSIFNKYVFEEEIKMFEEEGILKSRVTFENNSHIIDFFDKKLTGFFPLLDEKSILGGSDKDLQQTLPKNDRVIKLIPDKFIIKHYAEAVEYTWGDFSTNNVERANSDIQEFLNKIYSNISIFSVFVQNRSSKKRGSIGTTTITSQFRTNLNQLINDLMNSELYFIRCIKPNEENRANYWVEEKVEKQLNYCGITSAIELARQTFPVRINKQVFLEKYEPIYLKLNLSGLEWLEKIESEILIGKTRVFFTNEKLADFNFQLLKAQKELMMKIVWQIKSKFQRNNYSKIFLSQSTIWNNYLIFISKKELQSRRSVSKIFSVCFALKYRRKYNLQIKLINRVKKLWLIKKEKEKSQKMISLQIIRYFIRKNYIDMAVKERENLENIINKRIESERYKLEYDFEKKLDELKFQLEDKQTENENLRRRNKDLEKYEKLYNELYKNFENSCSVIEPKQTESVFNFDPLGISFFGKEPEKQSDVIKTLTDRVEFETSRYELLLEEFDLIERDYSKYKRDMRDAQILMGEKLHNLYMTNINLQEENVRLLRDITKNNEKKWYMRFF